jgi:hypothetical protein
MFLFVQIVEQCRLQEKIEAHRSRTTIYLGPCENTGKEYNFDAPEASIFPWSLVARVKFSSSSHRTLKMDAPLKRRSVLIKSSRSLLTRDEIFATFASTVRINILH